MFGAGGVGLNVIQGAAIAGAERIIAVDMREEKLERARTFGATDGIDASQVDAVKAVRELTAGRGVDYAFEVIGRKETIERALAATRRGGTCVVVGIADTRETVTLNAFGIPFFEKRLLGCWYGSADVHARRPEAPGLLPSGPPQDRRARYPDVPPGRRERGLRRHGRRHHRPRPHRLLEIRF